MTSVSDYTIATGPISDIVWKVSKPPSWRMIISDGFEWRPGGEMKIPNAFHRLMQRLLFGFRWERIPNA